MFVCLLYVCPEISKGRTVDMWLCLSQYARQGGEETDGARGLYHLLYPILENSRGMADKLCGIQNQP